VRLTVIGCSGSYPGPESSASCYLLEAEHGGRTWRLVMDMGSGALGTLHRFLDPALVDGVVLSHLHADHCLDLCGFYVLRKYHPTGAQPKIPVWGPEGTALRMAKAYDLDEDPGMNEEFDFAVHPARPYAFGPFTITATEVCHPVTAYALRVEADGHVLAYSGDTGVCDALVEAARGADLFLCEASFVDRGRGGAAGRHAHPAVARPRGRPGRGAGLLRRRHLPGDRRRHLSDLTSEAPSRVSPCVQTDVNPTSSARSG
jgi:ribonuclease BN (tRNA processing enzyme)